LKAREAEVSGRDPSPGSALERGSEDLTVAEVVERFLADLDAEQVKRVRRKVLQLRHARLEDAFESEGRGDARELLERGGFIAQDGLRITEGLGLCPVYRRFQALWDELERQLGIGPGAETGDASNGPVRS
jgi:hypothetical protein